jgi:hypothetical protein
MQKYTGVTIFGTAGISGNDIIQGSLNDCSLLAPQQAMADKKTRIENFFTTN